MISFKSTNESDMQINSCILDIGISAQSREHSAIDTRLQSTAAFGPQYKFLMRDMNILSVSGF